MRANRHPPLLHASHASRPRLALSERVDTICAYIDGKLGELLNRTEDQFEEKIERAWNANLITANERYDLHEIRKLRNSTEDMRQQVDNLKTWQIAQGQYADLLPDTKDRLLYVGLSPASRETLLGNEKPCFSVAS